MKITIECRDCRHSLYGEVPLGGSPAELIQAFGWVYSPASTGYLCRDCAAARGLVSTERRSA